MTNHLVKMKFEMELRGYSPAGSTNHNSDEDLMELYMTLFATPSNMPGPGLTGNRWIIKKDLNLMHQEVENIMPLLLHVMP